MAEKTTKLLGVDTNMKRFVEAPPEAEVRFCRRNIETGQTFYIWGSRAYESWIQCGAPVKVLWDNVSDIEEWRQNI